jgi:hypothetical protein
MWAINGLYGVVNLFLFGRDHHLLGTWIGKLSLLDILHKIPWWGWAILVLIANIVILFEGAFRAVRKREEERNELADKLQPSLFIGSTLKAQEDPVGGAWRMMYFEISNRSECTSINNGQAQLLKITPPPQNFEWLPIHLHIKHDNTNPPSKTFSLNPGMTIHIDLVSKVKQAKEVIVCHIVHGINNTIPAQKYTFTVLISGNDVPSCEQEFTVCVREDGTLEQVT